VYRLIPNKADLLRQVISDTIGKFMLNIDAEPMEALPTSEALERILVAYGTLTLSDETIAMNRLIIRECDQFPEIAAAFYRSRHPANHRRDGRLVAPAMRTRADQAR
jgi:AcrR family transcriptional regulator